MKKIIIIVISICILTLGAGIAVLHSGFAPAGVLDISAEGPLDFTLERLPAGRAEDIASSDANTFYAFSSEYDKDRCGM